MTNFSYSEDNYLFQTINSKSKKNINTPILMALALIGGKYVPKLLYTSTGATKNNTEKKVKIFNKYSDEESFNNILIQFLKEPLHFSDNRPRIVLVYTCIHV